MNTGRGRELRLGWGGCGGCRRNRLVAQVECARVAIEIIATRLGKHTEPFLIESMFRAHVVELTWLILGYSRRAQFFFAATAAMPLSCRTSPSVFHGSVSCSLTPEDGVLKNQLCDAAILRTKQQFLQIEDARYNKVAYYMCLVFIARRVT